MVTGLLGSKPVTDSVRCWQPMQFAVAQGTCGDYTGVEKGGAYDVAENTGKVGFEVVKDKYLSKPPAKPLWSRLMMGKVAYWRNHILVRVLAWLGIVLKAQEGCPEINQKNQVSVVEVLSLPTRTKLITMPLKNFFRCS
ncbi:hypothetical protein FNV43_RR27258 [Rhamnella rubrinervis]|uniref:Uncharacterized protein n=1 Tax=Rhamnella rubrinervis TaxID=2594499 RepID=A0A8K0DP33_9ROSA|nr:hypothetical protein FNV43_RR27258 [Rhamnella rubrinervis]